MTIKLKIAAVIAVLLVWWLWPSSEQERVGGVQAVAVDSGQAAATETRLSSAIEPINLIEPNLESQEDIGFKDSVYAKRKFDDATQLILKKEWADAEKSLAELIQDYPQAIESYINLAVVYTKTDRLDAARKILIDGVNANPNYATLFEHLKSIHGEIAASSYRAAMAEELDSGVVLASAPALDLSLINTIDMKPVNRKRQASLEKKIRKLLSINRTEKEGFKEKIRQLETENTSLNEQLAVLNSQYETDVASLQSQLLEQSSIVAAQVAEATDTSSAVQTDPVETVEVLTDVIQAPISQPVLVPEELLENAPEAVPEKSAEELAAERAAELRNQAIDRVKSWAAAWSSQDVDAYVEHYIDGYRPANAALTNQQWLAQRRVRLTNKVFIEVAVKDFVVRDLGEQFSVTFSQNYRSNTMDDTIRKQLVFAKEPSDIRASKIVSETVLR